MISWDGTMIGLPFAGERMLLVGHHQDTRFQLGFQAQRHVNGHLVTIEVSVERGTDQRMQLDRLTFDQHRLESLDAETVKGRRAVQHDRMLADNLFQDIPDFRTFFFHPCAWPP